MKETIVQPPLRVREDAFFYYPRNFDFLQQEYPYIQIANPFDNPTVQAFIMPFIVVLGIFAATAVTWFLPNDLIIGVFLVTLVSVVVGVRYGIHHFYGRWKNRTYTEKLKQGGLIIEGVLEKCVGTVYSNAQLSRRWWNRRNIDFYFFHIEIVYTFTTPQGTIRRARGKARRDDLNGVLLPQPATPIYVLYYNDQDFYLL